MKGLVALADCGGLQGNLLHPPLTQWMWAMVERISTSSSAKISATGPALSVAFEVLKNKERLLYFKSGPVVVGLIHKNAMPLQDPAVVM